MSEPSWGDLVVDEAQRYAQAALPHWPIEVDSLEFIGARENAVFKVTAVDGASYALRIHRSGYHSLPELESEVAWTAALRTAGIGTPRPCATSSGAWYAAVPFGAGGALRYVGMMEWIDGVGLDAALDDGGHRVLHHQLGALMAALHEHTTRWSPPVGFVRHSLDRDGLVGATPWWTQYWSMPEMSANETAVVNEARRRIGVVLDEFGVAPDRFGLIHADLLAENVLVREGRPFVIDFDDAGFGWHLYDMASVLVARVWTDVFEECRDALVAGYREVRGLPDAHLALLPVFIACRMLMQVGWVRSRVASSITLGPGRVVTRAELLRLRIDRAVRWCSMVVDA